MVANEGLIIERFTGGTHFCMCGITCEVDEGTRFRSPIAILGQINLETSIYKHEPHSGPFHPHHQFSATQPTSQENPTSLIPNKPPYTTTPRPKHPCSPPPNNVPTLTKNFQKRRETLHIDVEFLIQPQYPQEKGTLIQLLCDDSLKRRRVRSILAILPYSFVLWFTACKREQLCFYSTQKSMHTRWDSPSNLYLPSQIFQSNKLQTGASLEIPNRHQVHVPGLWGYITTLVFCSSFLFFLFRLSRFII